MADKNLNLQLRTSLDGKGFEDTKKAAVETEQQARKSASEMSASYEEAFGKIGKAAAVGFAAITAAIGFSVKAFAKQDDAVNKVRAAVITAGGSWDEFSEKTQQAASAIQSYSRFGDEELLPVLARMISMTGDAAGATENLGLVADVAAALQLDLSTAGDAVAKAMTGEAGRLGMLLPGLAEQLRLLGENATAADRAAVIMGRLGEFQGRAAEDALTLSGRLKQMTDAIGDAAEDFGAIFAPAVRDAAIALKEGAIKAGEWISKHEDLIATLTKIVLPALGAAAAIYAIEKAFLAAKIAFMAFNWTVSKTPWGLIIRAGIVVLTPAILYLIEWLGKTEDATAAAAQAAEELGPQLAVTGRIARTASTDIAKLEEATHFSASAFRDLMNASLSAAEALRITKAMPVLPAVDIVADSPGKLLDLELTMQQEANVAKLEEEKRAAAQRVAIWEQADIDRYNSFMESTLALQAAYGTFAQSLLDTEMTGKQRREAIWRSFTSTAMSQIVRVTWAWLAAENTKQAATVATGAVSVATTQSTLLAEMGAIMASIGRWLMVAAAKVYAFFAALGPFGIPAAAATVAAMIVAVRAIKFHAGGIVPGSGIGDTVPAMLTPGERIVPAPVYRERRAAIEAAIAGGGAGDFAVTINAQGNRLGAEDFMNIRRMILEMLPDAIEEMVARRRLNFGGA